MSTNTDNHRTQLTETARAIGAILGAPLALFAVVNSIIAQPLTSLIVALITAVLVSVWVILSRWVSITQTITAWLALAVVVLAGFVIWPKTMTLEGFVRDAAGNPVSREEVVCLDRDNQRYETKTDAEGHYQFTCVPTGKYKLRVRGNEIEGETKGFLVRVVQQNLTVSEMTPTASPTRVAAVTPNTPTATPAAPTDTPPLPPTLTLTPAPAATPTNTPTPMPTPTATPTNTPTLTPTPVVCPGVSVGSRSPHTIIQGVSFSLNGGPPQAASNEEELTVHPGDTISLLDLQYCSDVPGSSWDKVQGEASIRKNKNDDFDYDDGRYTTGASILGGEHQPIGAFKDRQSGKADYWTVQSGWDRLVIALVHYYQGGHEVDDRFFIKLVVQ